MDDMQKAIFLMGVKSVCEKDPSLVRPIIDAATAGVKSFADKQSDYASKMAFKLFSVVDAVEPRDKFGSFSAEEILEPLGRWYEGTIGLKKLKQKYGVEEDGSKSQE
jgi:hypothetical protein